MTKTTMLRRGALLSTSILAATLGYGRRAYAGSGGCVLSTGTTYICSGQVTGQFTVLKDNANVIATSDLDMTDNADGGLAIIAKGHLTFTDDPASAIVWEGPSYGLGVKSTDFLDTGSDVVQGLTITTDGTISGGSYGIYADAYTPYGAEAGDVSITVGGDVTGGTKWGIFARNKGIAPVSITVKDGATVSGPGGIKAKSEAEADGPGNGNVTITVDGEIESTATDPTAYGVDVDINQYGSATLILNEGASIAAARSGAALAAYRGDITATVAKGAEVSAGLFFGLNLQTTYGKVTTSIDGEVSGTEGPGLYAYSKYSDIAVTVGKDGRVAGEAGMSIRSHYYYGQGTLSITVDGEVAAGDLYAISAEGGADFGSVELIVGKTGRLKSESSAYAAVTLYGYAVSAVVAGEITAGTGARALELLGSETSLELRSGYAITGDVFGIGFDLVNLYLGGTETGADADSFDVSKIDDGVGDPEQFQGFNRFEKVGTGDWTLTGTTEAVESWAVKAGRLFVNATMSDTFFYLSGDGTTLGGTGTVGTLGFGSGAHIAPGNGSTPGTLTVDGNLNFAAGAFLDILVGKDAASTLMISRQAVIDPTAVVSLLRADAEVDYTSGKDYVIMTAEDGYSGTFSDTVDEDFAFLDVALSYVGNDVVLTLGRNGIDFGSVAATPNQRSVAGAIETLDGDIAEAITVLSEAEAQEAFETLSGNTIAVVPTLVAAEVESFGTLLQDRLQAVETAAAGGPSALALAYGETAGGDPTAAAFAAPSSAGFWLKGTGRFGALDGDGNGTGADYTMGGVTAGADTWLTPDLLAGLAFDYAAIDADFDGNAGSASVSSYALALYSRYRAGGLTLDGRLGYGVTENETRRRIVVGPDVATAAGDFDGDRFQAGFEAGYDLGRVAGTRLRPLASLGYVRIGEDGFTETGAGIYGLTVDGRVTESLKSGLGFELARSFAFGGRAAGFELTARALWSHEFLDDRATLDAAFASDPSVGFAVDGASVGRDSALLGLGATAQASEALTLYARYDARLNPDQTDHAVSAGLRVDW